MNLNFIVNHIARAKTTKILLTFGEEKEEQNDVRYLFAWWYFDVIIFNMQTNVNQSTPTTTPTKKTVYNKFFWCDILKSSPYLTLLHTHTLSLSPFLCSSDDTGKNGISFEMKCVYYRGLCVFIIHCSSTFFWMV